MSVDKLVDSSQLDADLTSVANAIRTRGGTSASLAFPSGFVSAIGAIPGGAAPSGTLSITSNGIYDVASFASADVNVSGGGSSDDVAKLISRELTTISDSNVSVVGMQAFYLYTQLTSVSFPNCTTINAQAFYGCSGLTELTFPKVSKVRDEAFRGCSKVTTISFPLLEGSLSASAFAACTSLSSVYLPNVSSIGQTAFMTCYRLTYVSLPKAVALYLGAFSGCSSLGSICLPEVQSIYQSAFQYCTSLSMASFDNANSIGASAFRACYHLLSLYLLGSSVCTLNASTAFVSSPISTYTTSTGGVYGSVFVRASLYSQYISATNWTRFSSRIVSLTDAQIAALDGGN